MMEEVDEVVVKLRLRGLFVSSNQLELYQRYCIVKVSMSGVRHILLFLHVIYMDLVHLL